MLIKKTMSKNSRLTHLLVSLTAVLVNSGCAVTFESSNDALGPAHSPPALAARASTYDDLMSLPEPRGKIVASVYNFRDQTGQYKPAPASSFSTAVTQGGASMLVSALNDSGWFVPLEREGLQNILTERKIIRAALKNGNAGDSDAQLPSLLYANVLLEGGIVAYESNVRTGGMGARYLGIGPASQYRVDEVTVSLRAVDIRTGRVLHNVLTSKSILSREVSAGVFTFVEFRRLLEVETGTTVNEPAQMCVLSAIESAVIQLIVDGIEDGTWSLKEPSKIESPVIATYMNREPQLLGLPQ